MRALVNALEKRLSTLVNEKKLRKETNEKMMTRYDE